MNTILKYELPDLHNGELREIGMPKGARILAVQVQRPLGTILGPLAPDVPCLWAMSNTEESKMVRRFFRIYATGRPIKTNPADLDYIGTVQTGPFDWHVFERKGGK